MNAESQNLRVPSTLRQTAILTAKNFKLFTRKPSILIFHVFVVFFVMLWIKYTNFLISRDSASLRTQKYPPRPFPSFQRCPFNAPDCLSLGIILFSDGPQDPTAPWIQRSLASVRDTLQLVDDDVKVLYQGTNLTEIGKTFDKFKEIKSVLFFCNNHTFVNNNSLVLGCDSFQGGSAVELDLNIYGIIYNQTAIAPNLLKDPNSPSKIDNNALILKKLIDESIIKDNRAQLGEGGAFDFDFAIASYPKPKFELFSRFDSLTVWASFHYVFLILMSFTQFVKLISQEKTNNLRKGLEPYGLSALAYWLSWVIFALVLNFFYTMVIGILAYLFGAITFTEIPPLLSGFLIFTTLTTYSFLGILITTACPDYRSASKVSYLIFIASLFLQIFFSQNLLTSMFFWDKRPLVLVITQWVLTLIPSFPFTVVCNNMHFEAGYHFDILTMSYQRGGGYNSTTYFTSFVRDYPFVGRMVRPADFYFQLIIMGLSLVFIFFIWILDHKVESNRGHKAKFFRCLKRFRRSAEDPNDTFTESELGEGLIENDQRSIFELRGLTKIFRHAFAKSKHITALDKVNLSIRKNETIALLGENGAGKSTLISILTGVIDKTEGSIVYDGRPYNPHNHQKLLISVCPQYDLLWTELTVFENLYIIGQFKGINPQQILKDIKEVLVSLNLKSQKHTLIRNLSGGMRRRASVGMALLGPSELVILDEPTTGLDPVNRKAVWNFIEILKRKGKTILMTTHIMDEADCLSDRIAIISRGRILKVARSIDIKNQFDKVNVIFSLKNFSKEFANDLAAYFEKHFPGAHSLKYLSEKRIKYNVNSGLDNLKRLVRDFEGESAAADVRMFDDYIDSFEIAVLDLEEAYILVNEEAQALRDAGMEIAPNN